MFANREEAGRRLGEALREELRTPAVPLVLGIPRGGVPVAWEVARALGAPLDVVVARKVGVPGHEELAMGAVAEDGVMVVEPSVRRAIRIGDREFDQAVRRELREVERRAKLFRSGRPREPLTGRTVVVVDDGLATGSTMRAAVASVRGAGAERIVVAAPVGALETVQRFAREADAVVCLETPAAFHAVGQWYQFFDQVGDDEVVEILSRSGGEEGPATEEVRDVGAPGVHGSLRIPVGAAGVVLFAHGSGSGRMSPRNRAVAAGLERAGFATLLVDLLTEEEARTDAITSQYRFDIDRLRNRLVAAIDWLGEDPRTARLPVGLFGSSTGAAAALGAAALRPARVRAVVSRGGRTDLVPPALLSEVRAAVLLIVGSRDPVVLDLNRATFSALRAERELAVVRGASHLFEEPGALEEVSRRAALWFEATLSAPEARPEPNA